MKVPVGKGISNGFQKGVATHPYRALGPWRSRQKKDGGEQDGLSVGRESRRPQGRSRSLKCWHSFEIAIADAEGFNVHRRQHGSIRFGEDVEGPPESTGRGMREEMRWRTREAPKAPGRDLGLKKGTRK